MKKLLAMLAVLTTLNAGCGSGPPETATQPANAEPTDAPAEAPAEAPAPVPTEDARRWTEDEIEFQLASIGEGTRNIDDATVDRYASLLDRAEDLFNDDREAIADCTVRAHQLATEQGANESIMSMLQAAIDSIPDEMAGVTNCVELYALLLTMMEAG